MGSVLFVVGVVIGKTGAQSDARAILVLTESANLKFISGAAAPTRFHPTSACRTFFEPFLAGTRRTDMAANTLPGTIR